MFDSFNKLDLVLWFIIPMILPFYVVGIILPFYGEWKITILLFIGHIIGYLFHLWDES